MPLLSELLAENRRSRSPFLDLGNCSLSEIPTELSGHSWIMFLSLGPTFREWDGVVWRPRRSKNSGEPNSIYDLGILAEMPFLQGLYLNHNPISNIRALSSIPGLRWLSLAGTRVQEVSSLANTLELEWLDVSYTLVRDLSPLKSLTELKELDVNGTYISDCRQVEGMPHLERLNLASTPIQDLRPVQRLERLRELDVSNTAVSDTAMLVGLPSLQRLNLANTLVANELVLPQLGSLKCLDISGTRLTDLSAISGATTLIDLDIARTSVTSLAPLSELVRLERLNCSGTPVTYVDPLAGLGRLRDIDLSSTSVYSVEPLSRMASLQTLDISKTFVRDLSLQCSDTLIQFAARQTLLRSLEFLRDFEAIERLDVAKTDVSDLSALRTAKNIEFLDISETKVRDLVPIRHLIEKGIGPIGWRVSNDVPYEHLWEASDIAFGQEQTRRRGLYLANCPLSSPPREIVAQGRAAILNFFDERLSDSTDFLYEAKLLILGEGGAGKTTLFRRLFRPDLPLPTEDQTTRGIDIHRYDFQVKDNRTFRLNVWDFGGQEIYHATHQFFLTQRSLYLLLDDTRKDHKSASDPGFMYWLDMIDVLSNHSPVLIFQNEKGGRSKTIDLAGIKGKYENVKDKYAGNLENLDSVNKFRDAVEFYASHLEHIGEPLPAKWLSVRADIEARAKEMPFMSVQEYFDIYKRHIAFDKVKALHLSSYLHDLGVFLHFQGDELLARWVILQNAWATDAVFRVLDDEVIKRRMGRFTLNDCARLWHDKHYEAMHPELLALMQRFELCYVLPDSIPRTWLAPQLLPPAKPAVLSNWGKSGDLVIRYRYEFMPKGLVSRLTVRLHRFVSHPEYAYINGVLFERENTKAFVELLPSGNEIEVRARGVERKALLSVVCSDLDALNSSFQGLDSKVQRWVPCICPRCAREEVPEFFAQRNLLRRLEDNRPKVECPASYEQVDVRALLDGVEAHVPDEWSSRTDVSRLRKVKIFLASSEELRAERDEFDLYFRQRNDQFVEQGYYLEVVRWENFLDAMSETRLQDEYNAAVKTSDIFVSLFATKTGRFTEEEFDVAHESFIATKRPFIYTFFKATQINTAQAVESDLQSLWEFKRKLRALGHFLTEFSNVEELKLRFRDQLELLLRGETAIGQ